MMKLREYFKSGDAWVWLNAGTVAIAVIMVVGVLGLIAVRGMGHFWPADVMQSSYTDYDGNQSVILGEQVDERVDTATRMRESGVNVPAGKDTVTRQLFKVGNRDLTGADFRWVFADGLRDVIYPEDIVVLERYEWGNFYGRLVRVKEGETVVASGNDKAWQELQARIARSNRIHDEIAGIEKGEIGRINFALEKLRLEERRLELQGKLTPAEKSRIEAARDVQNAAYAKVAERLEKLNADMARDTAVFRAPDGSEHDIPLMKIVGATMPNAMNVFSKMGAYVHNVGNFLFDDPREANTEGGVFPAIFGTVLMVLIMTIMVTPLGVIAAIYLREYAGQGVVTQTVRIAVNNLAGVPSIVYGVFGLGFFVYFLGGNLDRLFYPEAAPAPVFGTPGLLWASITLALLTLPVVIVATEEGLARIPRALKEGSLALGATKAETLWRVVLPMASPSIMTGVILAIARAAGEVAPLML
ncbi:MAG: phosphate ABC transporter permease PstA, partial [Gammaproteobacteria bacterium]